MSRYTILVGGKPTEMPSVTEILGMLDKPALKQWAVDCAIRCIENGGTLDEAKFAWKNRDALDVGSIVHHAIESHIAGYKPDFSALDGENLSQALASYKSFEEWEGSHSVRWYANELTVSLPPLYCGTLDALANIDGVDYILDFKTANGIYNDYWIQLAMYHRAFEHLRQNPMEYLDKMKMPHRSEFHGKFEHRPSFGILRLPKDGSPAEWKTKSFDDMRDFELGGFLACGLFYAFSKRRLQNNKVSAADCAKLFIESI